MITQHFWPTPNGYKSLIALEELGLPCRLAPVDIFRGEQHAPAFLALSPNGRIPALVDDAPPDGEGPLTLFESGAILGYLAERAGRLMPTGARGRHQAAQWLFWQVGGLGPMMGQAAHFITYAPEDVPYAKARYQREVRRLFGVLERRLADRPYLLGDYSIADIASYPWLRIHDAVSVRLDDFPRLAAWAQAIGARPAVRRAYELGEPMKASRTFDAAANTALFGQGEPREDGSLI